MTARHVRALRGTAAAAAATVVAATSHTFAGGGAPSPALVAALAILTTPLAVLLVGRKLTVWGTGLAVLAAQALFHLAFAVTAGADPAAAASHQHHLALSGYPAVGSALLPDPTMIAAHALAAAATMLVVYRGERLLRAIHRGIRSLLARTPGFVPALDLPVGPSPEPASAAPRTRILLSDLSRRGPPAFVTAIS